MKQKHTRRELIQNGVGGIVGTVTLTAIAGCLSSGDVSASVTDTRVGMGRENEIHPKHAYVYIDVTNHTEFEITAGVDITFNWGSGVMNGTAQRTVSLTGGNSENIEVEDSGPEDVEFNGASASARRL